MEGENSFDVDLGPDCSLQLLNGVHLVSTGEGGQTRVLLPLHRCIKLNEIKLDGKEKLTPTCCSMFCRFSMVADFGISSYRPGRFPTCSDEGRIFLKGLFQYSQNSYIYVHICILYRADHDADDNAGGDDDDDDETLTFPYAEADPERCKEQAENRDSD